MQCLARHFDVFCYFFVIFTRVVGLLTSLYSGTDRTMKDYDEHVVPRPECSPTFICMRQSRMEGGEGRGLKKSVETGGRSFP